MPFPPKRRPSPGSSSLHSHRTERTAPTRTTTVLPPYRAEKRDRRGEIIEAGAWRDVVEEALMDGRRLGSGTRVVSKNGVVLAKFENAVKFVTPGPRAAVRAEKASSG